MSTLNEIILECCKREIPVSVCYNKENARLEYEISGFYKIRNVKLYIDNDDIICYQDNMVDIVKSFEDLVEINRFWWNSSKERYDGWVNPDHNWINSLIEFGYIKKKETVVVTYVET